MGGGNIGLIHYLGLSLFNEYVVPFEISSVLFLSAYGWCRGDWEEGVSAMLGVTARSEG